MNLEGNDFKELDNNFVVSWTAKTILAIMVGAATGFAIAQLLFCSHSVAGELLGSILLGAIVGACIGFVQSSQMSHVVSNPKLWITASIVGWAIAVFLFEVNLPISGCVKSSNAPRYKPNSLIQATHEQIFVLAKETERMIEGEVIYGSIYNNVTVLLMGSLIGVILGVPQGIGQWWALRKDMPRSSIMIWVNALIWAITYYLILVGIDLANFNIFWAIVSLPIMLLPSSLVTALVLVWLRKKQIGDSRA